MSLNDKERAHDTWMTGKFSSVNPEKNLTLHGLRNEESLGAQYQDQDLSFEPLESLF